MTPKPLGDESEFLILADATLQDLHHLDPYSRRKKTEQKHNFYGYLRSKDGPGSECNLIATPIDSKQSLAYVLTFVHLILRQAPQWQSKDLLFLFYDRSLNSVN
jgi:hypothetical protein